MRRAVTKETAGVSVLVLLFGGTVGIVAGLSLVAVGDAVVIGLVARESQSDLAFAVALAVSGLLGGLLIGRWWAVALACALFLGYAATWNLSGQDMTFVAWLVLVGGLAASIQAAALAVGVGARWAWQHPDEVEQTLSR